MELKKHFRIKSSITVILYSFIISIIFNTGCRHTPEEEAWIPLFNGTDLNDWDIKIAGYDLNDNFGNTFRVDDGTLKISYDEYDSFDGRFGHIFYKKPFSHYKLRVEYRFVGEQAANAPDWAFRNNGVMFHSQSAQSMAFDQPFPISIEAQLLGGSGEGHRPTMNLFTPGTRVFMSDSPEAVNNMQSTANTFHGDQWVAVEIIVRGDSIVHYLVKGDTVLTFFKPQIGGNGLLEGHDWAIDGTPLKEGYIALQAESHPTEFRKVEILILDPDKP